jgi:hypothetical protein
MFGLHYSDTILNRVFTQQTSVAAIAGLAIPIYSATAIAGGAPLYNPTGSNRNIELISYDVAYASGTSAATFDGIFLMAGQVTSIGTGTGCSVFTNAPPINGLLLNGSPARALSGNGGTVTVTAGTATAPVNGVVGAGVIRTLYSTNLEAATATAHGTLVCKYTFDGTVVIAPGVLVYLAAIVASVSLYNITVTWKEVAIVPSAG